MPSSGERVSHRSCASGINLSSFERMLAGAGRGCGGCPPTNEGSSEVAISAARLLRRGQPLRELVPSSGERPSRRSCASGNNRSSFGRMLAGAGRACGGCPPTNEGSSEVAALYARLLRKGQPLRELGLSSGERASHRSCASGINRSSCGRMLAGASTSAARSSAVSAALSELTHAYRSQLRRGQPLRELGLSSGERPSHRSWASGNPLSSFGRMLAGAETSAARPSSTSAALSELTHAYSRLLRRSHLLSKDLDFAPVAGTILFA